MTTNLLWFMIGMEFAVVIGSVYWVVRLLQVNRGLKQKMCDLMHDKGRLTAHVHTLEDLLREAKEKTA
ncbi:MAG: hypothetical protein WCJ71_07155 [Candidatus Omnitrophota bacterium]